MSTGEVMNAASAMVTKFEDQFTKLRDIVAQAELNNLQRNEKVSGQLKQIIGEILMLRQAAVANNLKAGKVNTVSVSIHIAQLYFFIDRMLVKILSVTLN